jgi:hypothetical protein
MKKSRVAALGWRGGVLLRTGENPGRDLQMGSRMAKKHMPWEEIVLVALLGGFLTVGFAIVGLAFYRWTWDAQALVSMNGDEQNLYGAISFGIGFVVTAVVLAITTAKKARATGVVIPTNKKRPQSSSFEDRRRRRR